MVLNMEMRLILLNLALTVGLVDFAGKGKYRPPEFVWLKPVAPTALKFFNSVKLGKQYQNDMFVGDYQKWQSLSLRLERS